MIQQARDLADGDPRLIHIRAAASGCGLGIHSAQTRPNSSGCERGSARWPRAARLSPARLTPYDVCPDIVSGGVAGAEGPITSHDGLPVSQPLSSDSPKGVLPAGLFIFNGLSLREGIEWP